MASRAWVVLTAPIWDSALEVKVVAGQRLTLAKELKISESLFGIVTSLFTEKNKPLWRTKIKGGLRSDLIGELATTSTPFHYLVTGTKSRYAILSQRYQRRSIPGRIAPGSRGGRVLARGSAVPASYAKKRRIPPGRWDKVIARQRVRPWAESMARRMLIDTGNPMKSVRIRVIL